MIENNIKIMQNKKWLYVFIWKIFAITSLCFPGIECLASDIALTREEIRFAEAEGKLGATDPVDCNSICDPNKPNYLCLQAGTLGLDRDTQIKGLIARLRGPQPITLSQKDLINIFNLQGDGLDQLRQDTTVENNTLSNAGAYSTVTAQMTTGLTFNFNAPAVINYSYQLNKSGFQLDKTVNGDSFTVVIDDDVLQGTYGGVVNRIYVQPELTIITTDHGCISYDPAPQLHYGKLIGVYENTVQRRMQAERLVGASSDRVNHIANAYSKIGLLKQDNCQIFGSGNNKPACKSCTGKDQISCTLGNGTNVCQNGQACINIGKPCSNN